MSRKTKYRTSRVLFWSGIVSFIPALVVALIGAVSPHFRILLIAGGCAFVAAIVALVVSSRMDPRESWEKAAGGGLGEGGARMMQRDLNPAEREAGLNGFRLPDREPRN